MRRTVILCLAFFLPFRAANAGCAPVAMAEPRIWLAAATDDSIEITFLGHASFQIVSPAGISAVTDYNGMNIPAEPPDIATMNHAHSTHYTLNPDPRIRHVLRGWTEDGRTPAYDLTVGDMHVSNVPTNIRTWGGATERYGNSIFVFEAGGLCIAHLGHLHHLLEPADIAVLGHIDIAMVAVDDGWTMSQKDVAAVVEQLQPRVVLPMHYFTRDILNRFLDLERGKFAIDIRTSPVLDIGRDSLPAEPTIIALPGGY